ncbi:MarR family transcriptional regulator [Streptomyces sp. NPDC006430]|uniref:MarR family transcriptional regulator n=1 Tax=Streptomyces sp. NPDC006430 TaxID=3154299 RepID=UPI00339E6AB6
MTYPDLSGAFAASAARVLPLPSVVPSDRTTQELAQNLIRARHERFSGTLVVLGAPGGTFYLANGAIVAVESPGAPTVETLLLSSGRVGKAEWAAAYQAGAADGRMGTELIERMLVGAAEFQLMCLMAALDGALSVGMGRIDECLVEPGRGGCHLMAPQGIEPDWLFQEASRRIKALASLRVSLCPFRDRMTASSAGAALLSGSTAGTRREILLRVNGRRSARDISFLLGRGLYAVTVELMRMLSEGLVEVVPSYTAVPVARPAEDADRMPNVTRLPYRPAGVGGLPRRQRGMSGIHEVLPLRPVTDCR